MCRGNDIQMFVRVIPSQGDVFGCLGSNPSARFDIDGATVVYKGLPRNSGHPCTVAPRRHDAGNKDRLEAIVIFVEE